MLARTPVPADIGDYIRYDSETGHLVWIKRTTSASRVTLGTIAGGVNKTTGYIRVKFRDKKFAAHRLAFYLMGITIADHLDVDHINGDRTDNRWCNLRLVTRTANARNAARHRKGRTPGVSFHKTSQKWRAYIRVNGKQKQLGLFKTEAEAIRRLNEYDTFR